MYYSKHISWTFNFLQRHIRSITSLKIDCSFEVAFLVKFGLITPTERENSLEK